MAQNIFGIIGEPLAGKRVVGEYIKTTYAGTIVTFSDFLVEILNTLCIDASRVNITNLAIALRQLFGEDVLMPPVLKRLQSLDGIVVIDGVRKNLELAQLKSRGAKLIYVTAPIEIRYKRYLVRKEKTDEGTLSFEDFCIYERNSPNEKNLANLGLLADFRVVNEGELASLHRQLDEIFNKL